MLLNRPPRLVELEEARFREVAAAAVRLTKAGAQAVRSHALAGRLYLTPDGWLLLSVPNALGRGAFEALGEVGAELPSYDGKPYNAHITVMRPEETAKIGPGNIVERGKQFRYTLGPLKEVDTSGRTGEYGKFWVIEASSPELAALRRSYGLASEPEGVPFHISVAARRKFVRTGAEPVVKRSAEECPEGECCPHCGARLERDPYSETCNGCGKPWPAEKAAAAPGGPRRKRPSVWGRLLGMGGLGLGAAGAAAGMALGRAIPNNETFEPERNLVHLPGQDAFRQLRGPLAGPTAPHFEDTGGALVQLAPREYLPQAGHAAVGRFEDLPHAVNRAAGGKPVDTLVVLDHNSIGDRRRELARAGRPDEAAGLAYGGQLFSASEGDKQAPRVRLDNTTLGAGADALARVAPKRLVLGACGGGVCTPGQEPWQQTLADRTGAEVTGFRAYHGTGGRPWEVAGRDTLDMNGAEGSYGPDAAPALRTYRPGREAVDREALADEGGGVYRATAGRRAVRPENALEHLSRLLGRPLAAAAALPAAFGPTPGFRLASGLAGSALAAPHLARELGVWNQARLAGREEGLPGTPSLAPLAVPAAFAAAPLAAAGLSEVVRWINRRRERGREKRAVSAQLVLRALRGGLERGLPADRLSRFVDRTTAWAPGAQQRAWGQAMAAPVPRLPGGLFAPVEGPAAARAARFLARTPEPQRLDPAVSDGLARAVGVPGRDLPSLVLKAPAERAQALVSGAGAFAGDFRAALAAQKPPGSTAREVLGGLTSRPVVRTDDRLPVALHELGHVATAPVMARLSEAGLAGPRWQHLSERLANRQVLGRWGAIEKLLGARAGSPADYRAAARPAFETYRLAGLRHLLPHVQAGLAGQAPAAGLARQFPAAGRRVLDALTQYAPAGGLRGGG